MAGGHCFTRCVASLFALLLTSPVQSQPVSDTSALHGIHVDSPPRLEWFLNASNGTHHKAGAAVNDFRQREPGDGIPVSQSTTAFVSYDETHLYVVFVCKDEPTAIRANLARREEISDDDAVAVYLDTFHDRERAYVFMVNPLGVQLDGIVTEGQSDDYAFDTVWDSEGRLTSDGYVVRMAIPFRSLRFPRRPDQTWGLALARLIRRNNEEAYWPHVTSRVQGFVPQFGAFHGLRNISPGRNAEVRPYGVLARARVLDDEAAALRAQRDERVGLDAKLVVRDAVTLDATLNPDFSQVESDDPQVTVNERFEVFFPEKRPFFIENAGFFQTPIALFFSRRIVDPRVGARMTGKVGPWAMGAIAIDDRDAGRSARDDSLAGRRAAVAALRVQREVREESTVGLLVTDREFAGGFDRAVGFDTRLKLNANWTAQGQFVRSETRGFDGARRAGNAAVGGIDYDGRHVEYQARYTGFTPAFSAPLGFVQRVGFHEAEQEWEYNWRPERSAVVSFGPSVAALFTWDRSGRLQDRELAASFQIELPGETEIEFGRLEAFERFSGLTFHPHASEVSISTNVWRWLGTDASYVWGAAVNHDPATGLSAFLASAREADIGITLRPSSRLRVRQAYAASALKSGAARIFEEHRLRSHLTYQFTRLLSLRSIVDYERVAVNPRLTDEDGERVWSGDVLLTFLVNPGTAIHVGYIDRFENVNFPGSVPALPGINGLTSVGRQVFVKISYLLNL